MKYKKILLVLLCAFLLVGCQKTENMDKAEESAPQETNVGQSKNQKDMQLNEEETDSEGNDLIENINKYMIPEQSFDISLNDWGEVTFVSCMPMQKSDEVKNLQTDVSFYLIADEQVVYRFPYVNILENDKYTREDNIRQWGTIDWLEGISFVAFTDVNGDGKDDVLIGILYYIGAGSQGAIPRIEVRIYEDNGSEFIYNESICNELWDLPYDTTAEYVKHCIIELSRLERQEDMQSNKEEINLDENDSIENINKYMIPEQSFDVSLEDWGEVTFVSRRPSPDEDWEVASFYLIKDNQVLYKFPYRFEDNSSRGYIGLFDSVGAVAFRDINDDKKDDIIIITYYTSGAGPTGMVPRPGVTIYLAGDNEFCLAAEMIIDVEENIIELDRTIANICSFLQHRE